jgi:hypothetical protein
MIKFASRCVSAGLVLALLAGCSSSQDESVNLGELLFTSLKGAALSRRGDSTQPVNVTPEMHAKIVIPLLQVNPVTLGGSDFLQRVVARRDSLPGAVEVWKSSDNAQIFLRNGVVVGTRGIGSDIIAADANYTVNALITGASGSGIRTFTVSDGDVTTTKKSYRCDMRNLGLERIIVVDKGFAVNHFSESCSSTIAGEAGLRNEFWVERGTGVVRKSNQWIGPAVGNFEMILLKK